ncbi:MAG: hypothetical protein AABY40_03285, partial [Nanoarchaeota archaeon]
AGIDALIPTETDNTLVSTLVEATTFGICSGIGSKYFGKNSTTYAAKEAGTYAFGSAVGQTLYQLLKIYSQ